MDPPRPPGSGWLQSAGGNKNQPTLAPTPDPSQITRAAPLPADLIARNGGDPGDEEAEKAEQAKRAAEEQAKEEEEEELCAICYDELPGVGRGIIACGHVYCFTCIHKWCKTQNDCPGCRFKIRRILKTLSPEDVSKENARKKRDFDGNFKLKKQRDRAKRRAGRVKTQKSNVVTKQFRVRPATLKPSAAQQRAEPHPEAPGGWMHAEAQAAARQRLQLQQHQQQRQIQPVEARGELAELAESMRLADGDEVEEVARDQAAAAIRDNPSTPQR